MRMTPKVEKDWVTESGLRALCIVVAFGEYGHHRCGYVEIKFGRPLFGMGYDEAQDISVHGGLTFADRGGSFLPSSGWWFGFDCAHWGDGEIELNPNAALHPGKAPEPKSLEFVVGECESLAAQLSNYVGKSKNGRIKNLIRKPASWS